MSKLEDWLYKYVGIGLYVNIENIPKLAKNDFTGLTFYGKVTIYGEVCQGWGCYHNMTQDKIEVDENAEEGDLWEPIQDLIEALRIDIIRSSNSK